MDKQQPGRITQALSTRRLSGKWTVNDILAILAQLANIDKTAEAEKKRYIKGFAISVVGFILLIIAAFNVAGLLLYATLLFIVLLPVLMRIVWKKYKESDRMDFSNEFRAYLAPLLKYIKDDIRTGSPVSLTLDLTPAEDNKFHKMRGNKYKKGPYHECYNDLYERRLLTMSCRLKDNSHLSIICEEALMKMSMTKKTQRGKTKMKKKYKRSYSFSVRLVLKEALPASIVSSEKITVRNTPKGAIAGVKYKEKLVGEETMPDPMLTLKSILGLYRHIRHAAPSQGQA